MEVMLSIAHSLPMTGKVHSGARWSWTWSKAPSDINCSKARNSCSLWSVQFWPTATSSLTGSHNSCRKTLILTRYQLQIIPTIHQIVIWYNYLWRLWKEDDLLRVYSTQSHGWNKHKVTVRKDINHAYLTNPQSFNCIISGVKSWAVLYSPETKFHSMDWRTISPLRVDRFRSSIRGPKQNVDHFMKRKDQQDATIRCLLLTSVSTCFGHHYAHLQENKGPVTAFGALFCNKRET